MKKIERIRSVALMLVIMLLISIIPTTKIANAASVKISSSKETVYEGFTVSLKVTGTTSKASWNTSDKKIATVSSSGKVTAVKEGKCTITAKVKKNTYKCVVTVKKEKLNKTSLSLEKGKSETVKLASGKVKSFSTSDKSIATVSSSGKITAKKKGSATITCTSKNGKKYTCKVTVKDKSAAKEPDKKKDESKEEEEEKPKACEHTYDTVVDVPATCKSVGTGRLVCSKCGDTKATAIPKTSHTYADSYKDVNGTCTVVHTCSVCGNEYTGGQPYTYVSLPYEDDNYKFTRQIRTNHVFEEGKLTANGVSFTCKNCKRVEVYKPECKHKNTVTTIEGKGTSSNGTEFWTEVTKCALCGIFISNKYVTKECDHNYVLTKETLEDESCLKGKILNVLFKCSKCGDEHTMKAWDQFVGEGLEVVETGVHETGYNFRRYESVRDEDSYKQWVECGKLYKNGGFSEEVLYDFEAIFKKTKGCSVQNYVKNNYPASLLHEYDVVNYEGYENGKPKGTVKCSRCGDELTNEISDCVLEHVIYFAELENVINHIIKPGMTDMEKAKAVYGFMCDELDYDHENYDREMNGKPTIPRELTLWSKLGMCAQFARMYKDFMTLLNIECVCVEIPELNHMNNAVYIDNKWWYLDLTSAIDEDSDYRNRHSLFYENKLDNYPRCCVELLTATDYSKNHFRCKLEAEKWYNQTKKFGFAYFDD